MPKKILVVEDEPDVLEMLTSRLQDCGYEVLQAPDGFRAIRQAHNAMPDLIILDVNMPAGRGDTVYQNLKQTARTQAIPVFFLSAIPEADLGKMAGELSAAGYLSKPYDPNDLLEKVKGILGE